MLLADNIKYQYKANTCHLSISLESGCVEHIPNGGKRQVENFRNCDIFIDDYNFYLYADVKIFRFHSKRCFDIKDLKTLTIQFDTKERCYKLQLRCLPPEATNQSQPKTVSKERIQLIAHFAKSPTIELKEHEPKIELWKLKRITDICRLKCDNAETEGKFECNYGYGFARMYMGKVNAKEIDKSTVRITEPSQVSPLQRSVLRAVQEMKHFSREQYKLNFVELQVPDGIDNPMNYSAKLNDTALTQEQANLLHNLTCKPEHKLLPTVYDKTEIQCGLVSILLAICYDVRCTDNEPTCESGWTRSILSPALGFFEVFTNYKSVVLSFMRRALIYPLFRNYELARICVLDAINALNAGPTWILKQLLITHEHFSTSEPKRELFNQYYIEDYIRYIANPDICTIDDFHVMARNIKNIWFDVTKLHLDLNLNEIETELVKELIDEMCLAPPETDDDDDDEDDEDDDDDENDDDDHIIDVDDIENDDDIDDVDVYEDDEDNDDDDDDDNVELIDNNDIVQHHHNNALAALIENINENMAQNNEVYPNTVAQIYDYAAGNEHDDNNSSSSSSSSAGGSSHGSHNSTSSSHTEGNSVIEQCNSEQATTTTTATTTTNNSKQQ